MWIRCDKNTINADLVKIVDCFGQTIRFMDQKPGQRSSDAFVTCVGTITCDNEGEAKTKYDEIIKRLIEHSGN